MSLPPVAGTEAASVVGDIALKNSGLSALNQRGPVLINYSLDVGRNRKRA